MREPNGYIHEFSGDGGIGGQVALREYRQEGEAPVILCSQLHSNRYGPSPTNYVEQLIEEVSEQNQIRLPVWWRRSGTTDEIVRWIEHYPAGLGPNGAETYHVVVCDYKRRRGRLDVRHPRWVGVTRDVVERMIGQSLDA